jgi:hypothetical protein
VKSENEIRKQLEKLKSQRLNSKPYTELKNIAWHGTIQALEWVLEEKETPLTF